MTMHLRSLPTGARFVLCRTGDRYTLFRRDRDRWGGTVIVVLRDGAYTKKDGTLPGWKKTGCNNMTGEGH